MKTGSLKYLRMISTAVLDYNEKWRSLDEQKIELPAEEEDKRAETWKNLVDLAEEIKEAIGIEGKK